ncbi:MAG: MBL fold metallo-hydrolase [Chitinophagaceae bacterium]|nr:MBL fold metallo-hydrolase [Chitinophagaceae bacterium]
MLTLQSFTYGPFQENTYVLYNEHNEAIIIDPGMYELNEFDAFFSYLSEMDLKPTLLLNTHTHIDHIFGNAAVVMKYKVPLAFHELDKPVFDHQLTARAMYNLTFVPSPAPDYYLKENELVTLGSDSLQILLCPGHSPGSVCFYHKEQQFVIGGDVLFQQSIGRSDLPGGDYDTLVNSIHTQLFTLPDEVSVYSGHGPKTSIGFEKMNNPFVGKN